MTARQIFKAKYGTSKNFMTPRSLGYFLTKTLAIELAAGRGIYDNPIYGVTVVEREDLSSNTRSKLSQLFQTETQARAYIDKLKAFSKCNYTVDSMLYELSLDR